MSKKGSGALAKNIKNYLINNWLIEPECSSLDNDMTSKNPLSHQSKVIYPKLKGFKIGHLDITSLTKHIEELRIFIHENSFEILCINETRLDNSTYDTEIEIAGYEIVRKDRNWNGGGVAIYLRNNIPYVERGDLTPVNVEAICLEIRKPKSKPLLISTWYRPPDSKFDLFDRFEKFIQEIDNENKEMIITGDFNCDMLSNDNNNPNIKKIKRCNRHLSTTTTLTVLLG